METSQPTHSESDQSCGWQQRELERRQDEVLAQLEQLDRSILALLEEYTQNICEGTALNE